MSSTPRDFTRSLWPRLRRLNLDFLSVSDVDTSTRHVLPVLPPGVQPQHRSSPDPRRRGLLPLHGSSSSFCACACAPRSHLLRRPRLR
ncbi:hypothetical protein IG631_17252 [Alternaria alternata]|nr:hypothetical protein IG631_17252 [Alternaria alternata]